jgi:hypothetical protein
MPTLALRSASDEFLLDADTGQLLSLRPLDRPDTELLATAPDHPAFALHLLTAVGEYLPLTSHDAGTRAVEVREVAGGKHLHFRFGRLGGHDLDVELQVSATPADASTRWSLRLRNGTGLRVAEVQFPFVVVPADGQVVLPTGHGGQLLSPGALAALPPDEPERWRFCPENGNSPHYPGRVFAQMLAWYDEGGGVYLACDDTAGHIKLFQALRCERGVRLGIGHVGDWPTNGQRQLEYRVELRSFRGDWMDAADLYRAWALQQPWATPLAQRQDLPAWLLDSPPHITLRLQGYVDDGPAPPIAEFLPYEKCLPLLQHVADAVEAPLVAVLMAWERGGPWVYPDCFPPVGGDESLAAFVAGARARGWHVGSFCNGTRWVLKHLFNDYDGTAFLEEHDGRQGLCRREDGTVWEELWDRSWRPSFLGCMAHGQTRQLAEDFVRRLVGWGMESIQFFDQNCNAATFPCFAGDHGHPPQPGRWMTAAMGSMIATFRQVAAEAGEAGVIQSTECPCNEVCLPLFAQSDVRISVPGSGQLDYVPLYHWLYHECTLMHGMMSFGPDPYALETRNAWNGVWGLMPGAVMCGDGTLLNRETWNWAEWSPPIGRNDTALAVIRNVTAMRRGAARDFLVFGRLQRPADITAALMSWDCRGQRRELPAVAHAAWRAPDGRHGVVLANWTEHRQPVHLCDVRLGASLRQHTWPGGKVVTVAQGADGLDLEVPTLGCALLSTG